MTSIYRTCQCKTKSGDECKNRVKPDERCCHH